MFLKGNRGYTLIEIMLVVGITAILASIALPNLKQFQVNSRQAEVKATLNHVLTLEQAYYFDTNTYVVYGTGYDLFYGYDPKTGGTRCDSDPLADDIKNVNKLIGFKIDPCSTKYPRYAYQINNGYGVVIFEIVGVTGTGAANRLIPNCGKCDLWKINGSSRIMYRPTNESCPYDSSKSADVRSCL